MLDTNSFFRGQSQRKEKKKKTEKNLPKFQKIKTSSKQEISLKNKKKRNNFETHGRKHS